MWIKSEQQ
jgi:chromosome segregation ATPase